MLERCGIKEDSWIRGMDGITMITVNNRLKMLDAVYDSEQGFS